MKNARFFDAYYITNGLLLLAYVGAKLFYDKHGKTAYSMLNEKSFSSWEQQCTLSLFGIVVLKFFRRKTMDHYLSEVFWYGKVTSVLRKLVTAIMLFLVDLRLLLWFLLLCWMAFALLPQPELRDDESQLVWLTPIKFKSEVLDQSSKASWLVAFSSPHHADCVHAMPFITETANKYTSEHLKFGLMDVSVFKRIAAELKVDTSTVSRELPALVLFEKGKFHSKLTNKAPRLFSRPSLCSERDIVRAFSLQQRSKGEAMQEHKKKR